jgi:protocatechuate 3,4-dioxygenase alpha subunit
LASSPIRDGAKGEAVTISGVRLRRHGMAAQGHHAGKLAGRRGGLYPGQDGADPAVTGFCRFAADGETGEFTLRTVKPGRVALRDGRMQAPHISLWLVARGINIGLQTRLYFEDEDNAADPLLSRIEQRPACRRP